MVDGGGDVVGEGVAEFGDFAGGGDEAAELGHVSDDAGVAAGAGGGGGVGLEADEGGEAADGVEEAGAVEFVGDGDGVGGFAAGVEGEDGVVDVAVGGFVELVGGESGFGGGVAGRAGEEGGAEEGGFGVEVLGGYAGGGFGPGLGEGGGGGGHQEVSRRSGVGSGGCGGWSWRQALTRLAWSRRGLAKSRFWVLRPVVWWRMWVSSSASCWWWRSGSASSSVTAVSASRSARLWRFGGIGLGRGWRWGVCWGAGREEVGVGLAGFGGEPADGAGGDAPVSDHAGGGVDGVADLAVVVGGESGGDAVEVGDTEEPATVGRLDERLDEVFHLGEGSCRGGGRVGAVDDPRGGVADLADVADGLFR